MLFFFLCLVTIHAGMVLEFKDLTCHDMTELRQQSDESQIRVVHYLKTKNIPYEKMWIVNEIIVDTILSEDEWKELKSNFPEITHIRPEDETQVDSLEVVEFGNFSANSTLWHIPALQVDRVWNELNLMGEEVVIGVIDSGARATHEALHAQRYLDGPSWFDPYNVSYEEPTDSFGHGTHILGSILSIAPRAKWIVCRGCNGQRCTEKAILSCAQFMSRMAPHLKIINNSWSTSEVNQRWLASVVNMWSSLNISSVFSNGNQGPHCGSVTSPADLSETFSVGATTQDGTVWERSSRGPDYQGGIKPNVVAPGVQIIGPHIGSDTAYAMMSGTSQAAPQAAGILALMYSANKPLSVAAAQTILQQSSRPIPMNTCLSSSSDTTSQSPNNAAGHGILNAYQAVQDVLLT